MMVNNVLSVKIQLDKIRHLKLGYRAMKKYEEAFGGSFIDAINEFIFLEEREISPKITTLINVAWVGLVWEDETLTPDSLADLFDEYGIEDLFGKIQQAVNYSIGGNEGNGEAGATNKKQAKVTPA